MGKTTLAFHLGTGLAWLHNSRVLLIDMDHQSSLSILCLGTSGWEEAIAGERLVNGIFQHFVDQGHGMPGDDIIIHSPMNRIESNYDSMDLVSASLRLDDIEIELTATHQGNAIRSEWNKRTLVCRWIEETGIDDIYDYIVFDCPPATKIVAQNAVAASHGYIVPVMPEAVMERGAPHLRDMIRTGIDARLRALAAMGDERAMYVPDTELVGLAITRIQRSRGHSGYINDHTQHLGSLQRRWRDALIEPYILLGAGVPEALTGYLPVYNFSTNQNVGKREIHLQYEELVGEIKRRVDAL